MPPPNTAVATRTRAPNDISNALPVSTDLRASRSRVITLGRTGRAIAPITPEILAWVGIDQASAVRLHEVGVVSSADARDLEAGIS
jgi:hypothetical protein